MRVRVKVTVILAVALTAVGCGSSTGPKKTAACNSMPADAAPPTTPAALAVHLDSLQQLAATCGQSDRARLLTYPIAALAQNVTPASISLTVNGSSQPYSAAGLEVVATTAGASPTVSDSFFVFVAWSDAEASQLFILQAAAPDSLVDWENLAGTVDNIDGTSGTASVALASNGAACGTPVALPFSTFNELVSGTTCSQATINITFNVAFAATTTNPNTSYAFTSSSLPSARIIVPATGGQLRVPPGLALGVAHGAR